MADLRYLSGVELRLELAEALAVVPKSIAAQCRKKNRIREITNALVASGAF